MNLRKTFLIITFFLVMILSCNEKVTRTTDQSQSKSSDNVSGVYVSIDDANSSIEIKNNKYYMHCRGIETASDSIFDIEILDRIKIDDQTRTNGRYLRLKNSNEILEYKINSWDSETVSLTYLPRGNTLTYKKK